jgi:hypothetical protein
MWNSSSLSWYFLLKKAMGRPTWLKTPQMPTLEASQFTSNNFSKSGNAKTGASIIFYFTN